MTIVGVDTSGLPSQKWECLTVTHVLVLGENSDVTCYKGHGSPNWVSLEGDKVTLCECELHFPAIRSEMVKNGWTYRGLP